MSVDARPLSRLRSPVLPTTVSDRRIPLATIREAAAAVYGAAIRTPLIHLEAPAADGAQIYLKLETLQPIGSFKLRGAYNVVRQLTPERKPTGSGRVSHGWASLEDVGAAGADRPS